MKNVKINNREKFPNIKLENRRKIRNYREREREKEREREIQKKKLNRDLQTMELKMEEGRGFAETVASNTKISNTDKEKNQPLAFERLIFSKTFRIHNEFMHLFEYNCIRT